MKISTTTAISLLNDLRKADYPRFIRIGSYKKDGSYKVRTIRVGVRKDLKENPKPVRYDPEPKGLIWAYDVKGHWATIIGENITDMKIDHVKYEVFV